MFSLIVAPPAAGKTQFIFNLITSVPSGIFIYLSPLRALADEFHQRAISQKMEGVRLVRQMGRDVDQREGRARTLIISTAEGLSQHSMADLKKTAVLQQIPLWTIIDEFHLFFHWGDTFRPRLWQVFIDTACLSDAVLALTATLSSALRDEIQRDFTLYFDTVKIHDCGNYHLLHPPEVTLALPKTPFGQRLFALSLMFMVFQARKQGRSVLLFCRTRNEVAVWAEKYTRWGFDCMSCLGGEAAEFIAQYALRHQQQRYPHLIAATKVLSHGINLQDLLAVCFSYDEEDPDFLLQMIARAGRISGQKYWVIKSQIGLSGHMAAIFGFCKILWKFFQKRKRND